MSDYVRGLSLHANAGHTPIPADMPGRIGDTPPRGEDQPADSLSSGECVLLTRRPICDANRLLRAYEILADAEGPGSTSSADVDDVFRTIHVITNVVGVDTLAGDRDLLFVPATPAVLSRKHYLALPEGRTVLILVRASGDRPDLAAACAEAHSRGYKIAVEHDRQPGSGPIVEHATFVRASITGLEESALAQATAAAHAAGRKLVALDVNSNAALGRVVKAGCDLVQGTFLFAPDVEESREIPGVASLHIRLLAQLGEPVVDRKAVAQTIELDLALSHALLRRINSAAMGVRQRVSSISHALALLGDEHVRSWGSLTALAALKGPRPGELVTASLVRARLCSRLACTCGLEARALDAYFVGLFSALDAILAIPMERALELLPLADEVVAALSGQRAGPLARILTLAEACERGGWSTVHATRVHLGLSHSTVANEYYSALTWWRDLSRQSA